LVGAGGGEQERQQGKAFHTSPIFPKAVVPTSGKAG
jgi:hypothetical protein